MNIYNNIEEIGEILSPNSIVNADCLIAMKYIKDKSIDMILCDLPFGVTSHKEDIPIPFEPLWKEYERIIKDNGAIILFAQGLFYVDLVNSNRKLFKYDLIWDKKLTTGFLNAKRMPLRVHEQIAVFSKANLTMELKDRTIPVKTHEQLAIFYKKLPTYNPQFTEGIPLHSKGNSYKDKEHKNENYGKFNMTEDNRKGSTQKYPKSIISYQKPHPSSALHRTEKSIDCLEYLIKTYSNENDTILDNTMGSGSCLKAALNTNRKFIGIELNKDYFNVCIDRLK